MVLYLIYLKNGLDTMFIVNRKLCSQCKDNITLEVERIQLSHFDIKMCHGCRACFDKGEEKCPLKDELLVIWEKIHQADGILTASPVSTG